MTWTDLDLKTEDLDLDLVLR